MRGAVLVEVQERTAYVTLNHPHRLNAMTRAMWSELRQVFSSLAGDPGLRCALITGAQDHFCAGGDISEYPAFRFDTATLEAFHEQEVWGALEAMLAIDVPLVAQIRGACMGAGLEIASCCDIRLADTSATFGAPIARLGFPMAPNEAALVCAAVGESTARSMLLAAEILDATAMQQRGFLTRVCAADALETEVRAMLLKVKQLSPQAARLNKQTLRVANGQPDKKGQPGKGQAAAGGLANAYAYADSADHREGIGAFLAKRPALFS